MEAQSSNIEWTKTDNNKFMFDVNDDKSNVFVNYNFQLLNQRLFTNKIIAKCDDFNINLSEISDTPMNKILIFRHPDNDNQCIATLSIEISKNTESNKLEFIINKLEHLTLNNYMFLDETRKNNQMLFCGLFIFIFFILFNSYLMSHVENEWSLSKSIWFTIITISTVGFGDIIPLTQTGLIINCITITISTILFSLIFGYLINYLINYNDHKTKREKIKNNIYHLKRLPSVESQQFHDDDHDEIWSDIYQNNLILNGMKMRQKKLIKTFLKSLILLIFLIFIGSMYFYYFENENNTISYIKCLHFIFVIMSSVGYELIQNEISLLGEIIVIIYIFIGIITLTTFTTLITDYLRNESRDNQIMKILNNTFILNENDLYKFDIDGDGKITKFEFLCIMLLITNETSYKFIKKILKKFNELDKDNNGIISIPDLQTCITKAE